MLGKLMICIAVKFVAIATRVAWSAYQQGGSDQAALNCHHCFFWPQIHTNLKLLDSDSDAGTDLASSLLEVTF
jgi:hypothetical protein